MPKYSKTGLRLAIMFPCQGDRLRLFGHTDGQQQAFDQCRASSKMNNEPAVEVTAHFLGLLHVQASCTCARRIDLQNSFRGLHMCSLKPLSQCHQDGRL